MSYRQYKTPQQIRMKTNCHTLIQFIFFFLSNSSFQTYHKNTIESEKFNQLYNQVQSSISTEGK